MWAASASEVSREQDEAGDQLLREVREALPELQGEGADGDSAMVSVATVLCFYRSGIFPDVPTKTNC